jgi:hypothetical protein
MIFLMNKRVVLFIFITSIILRTSKYYNNKQTHNTKNDIKRCENERRNTTKQVVVVNKQQ